MIYPGSDIPCVAVAIVSGSSLIVVSPSMTKPWRTVLFGYDGLWVGFCFLFFQQLCMRYQDGADKCCPKLKYHW